MFSYSDVREVSRPTAQDVHLIMSVVPQAAPAWQLQCHVPLMQHSEMSWPSSGMTVGRDK